MNLRMTRVFLALMIFSAPLYAKITLPAVFSDGMILQRQQQVAIWGRSDAGGPVLIRSSWDNKQYTAQPGQDGSWRIKINTPAAGGPYSISFNDGEEVKLSDVLIGEVWLASGQSNMEMPLKGFKDQPVAGSEEAVKEADHPDIRFFNVKNISWNKPLDDCEGTWVKASPATAPAFSAVAYFYAKKLQEKLGVPVGIIAADWGGTVVQAWMSREALSVFPEASIPDEADEGNENKNTHCGLFNGMIHPVLGYGIRGVIWYQGEQNRHEPELYRKLFPVMVKQWREDWGIGDFAFYYAQIAPYIFKRKELTPAMLQLQPKVPFLREAQLESSKEIPNSGMAVLTDIGSAITIHPPDKKTVAERLALIAFAKTYGMKGVTYAGPEYKSSLIRGNTMVLNFDHVSDGLVLKNNPSENFEMAGDDRVFYPAKARVEGNAIVLSSDKVARPVAARYAFKAWVSGDLFNKAGLPASSFRTDDWELPNPNKIK